MMTEGLESAGGVDGLLERVPRRRRRPPGRTVASSTWTTPRSWLRPADRRRAQRARRRDLRPGGAQVSRDPPPAPATRRPARPAGRVVGTRRVCSALAAVSASSPLVLVAAGRGQLRRPAGRGARLAPAPPRHRPRPDARATRTATTRCGRSASRASRWRCSSVAALATAGALMQGVFGNPLAEPGVVGVSAGAAVRRGAVIVFGSTFAGAWTVAVVAFVGGLVTTLLVYALSRAGGRTEVVTLVLTGIAVNAFAGAGHGVHDVPRRHPGARGDRLLAARQPQRHALGAGRGRRCRWSRSAWSLPSSSRASSTCSRWATGPRATSASTSSGCGSTDRGRRAAHRGGRRVLRRSSRSSVWSSRTSCGWSSAPATASLVPASALGGALLLVAADLWARTAVAYADLPIGMLTSLVGGPFFFWLLRRTRRTAGGWA